jgi:hypothetical protein
MEYCDIFNKFLERIELRCQCQIIREETIMSGRKQWGLSIFRLLGITQMSSLSQINQISLFDFSNPLTVVSVDCTHLKILLNNS